MESEKKTKTKTKPKRKTKTLILCFLFGIISIYVICGNTILSLSEFCVKDETLPASFDGFRIVQISDLHNTYFGKNNIRLIKFIKSCNPDIIVITGDLCDSYHLDIDCSVQFVSDAMQIAPCYYVNGNHEQRLSFTDYENLTSRLIECGCVVLNNESIVLSINDEYIKLIGIENSYLAGGNDQRIHNITQQAYGCYSILLAHRPDLIEQYIKTGVNLVFCGHAHGGQFRLPFIGGVYSPNQGFNPKYDSGLYTFSEIQMVVSRGLGNSIFPFRLNNFPEVVLVTLSR